MATAADLVDAVNAGDAERARAILVDDASLVAARDEAGVSVLMLARYRFDREVTDALLAADPDLDVFEAAALGYVDRLRERLTDDPGAATWFSPDGFTALHFAAFFGKPEAAKVLLEHGASVDAYTRNPFANQPLHAAAAGRHIEVCRLLLAAGADVNATQHGGYTPLHEAAQHGDAEMTELFLSAGADPTRLTDAGETAADTAAAAGHADLADRIRAVGSGPSDR
jgi:adenosylhomocysteine nucleosidase